MVNNILMNLFTSRDSARCRALRSSLTSSSSNCNRFILFVSSGTKVEVGVTWLERGLFLLFLLSIVTYESKRRNHFNIQTRMKTIKVKQTCEKSSSFPLKSLSLLLVSGEDWKLCPSSFSLLCFEKGDWTSLFSSLIITVAVLLCNTLLLLVAPAAGRTESFSGTLSPALESAETAAVVSKFSISGCGGDEIAAPIYHKKKL